MNEGEASYYVTSLTVAVLSLHATTTHRVMKEVKRITAVASSHAATFTSASRFLCRDYQYHHVCAALCTSW